MNLKFGGEQGGKLTEEVKQKMRKPKTEEQKENYRISALNRPPVSEATREKHRKNMMGNKNLLGSNHMIGFKHSDEVKQVLKEKRKKQIGVNNPNYRHGKYVKK